MDPRWRVVISHEGTQAASAAQSESQARRLYAAMVCGGFEATDWPGSSTVDLQRRKDGRWSTVESQVGIGPIRRAAKKGVEA